MNYPELIAEIERFRARAERAEAALATVHGETESIPWVNLTSLANDEACCPYRDLIENLTAIVLFIDRDGIVRYANGFAADFFGIPSDEFPGTAMGDLLQACDHTTAVVADDLPGCAIDHLYGECEITRDDARSVWISWSHQGVSDSNGRLLGVVAIGTDITAEKETQQQLVGYQDSLRSLTSQLGLAEERERRRIAGRIHDEISQNLAYAKLCISALAGCSEQSQCKSTVSEVSNLLDAAIAGTRSLAFELSPPMLWELGFEDAVEWLVEQTDAHPEITCEFRDDGSEKPLVRDVSVTLFRAIRELLANVIRHADAEHAKVVIAQDNGHVEVCVEDDGIGLDPEQVLCQNDFGTGCGLFNIRERIEHLGGEMQITSNGGSGTRVKLHVPVAAHQ